MNRRRFLTGLGVAGLAAAGAGWRFWPKQGLTNPCRAQLPRHLLRHELVAQAWDGLNPAQMWDCHTHLIGIGDSGRGPWLNPDMYNLLQPKLYAQRLFFMNAGCVNEAPGEIDRSVVERMLNLVAGMRPGYKLMLLAFDRNHLETGEPNLPHTTFFVPNEYAQEVAGRHAAQFEWVASIHPYRNDAVAALEAAVKQGARAVKWLPPAQGMRPDHPRCDPFYQAMARLNLPLICHAGQERAVHGGDTQSFGNPLRLRRALDHGVRVIVAHCASLGEDHDLDQGENGPITPNFTLFARLMDDPRYVGRVFGDISAITQSARAAWLPYIIERQDWHHRLLHGSDYPIPGLMPIYSMDELADKKMLDPKAVPIINEIREYNPLLFDLVLKRAVRWQGKRLLDSVYHTRHWFVRDEISAPKPGARKS